LTNIHAALIMPVSAMQTHGVLPFILENDTMNYVDDVACEIETSESLGCDQIQYGWQPMMTDKGWTEFAYLENLTLPEKSGKRMKNLVFRVPPPTNNAPTAVYFKLFARGMDEIKRCFSCDLSDFDKSTTYSKGGDFSRTKTKHLDRCSRILIFYTNMPKHRP